ncbi:zinc-binding protein A33-like [Boleophthalmus pectinirostris]|uniref:zinc-binding protein A33-like n=1 Tax=Boleophthalmus pectinirostris TaxID=150288 RepID=UPI00242A7956|nr:zinc-binding protein A33-like [Boleophthalmus pectinirostris]
MACAAPSDFSELCGTHQAPLSVFCLDDLLPLCPQCADEDHSQHRVYLLSEAAADCKGELSISLNNLKQRMTVIDKETQNYQQVSKHNQGVAELAEEQIKREFKQLHEILQEEEANRLLLLKQDKDKKLHELQEQTKLMDELVVSLEERIRLTEAELNAGGDGSQFLKDYQVPKKRHCTDMKKPKTFLMNVAEHLGNLKFSVWKKMKHSAVYSPVTLDARTAGQGLTVSFTLNTAHCSPAAMGPEALCVVDHPGRFQPYSSVLAREGFSSGVHSWDVEVGECDNWTVGVASQSIQRQVPFEACPECGLWCISLRDGQYLALTTPAQTLPYSASNPLKRIHVRLNFDSGILEFQNAEMDTNIFIFNHNFTETVYPYFETISHTGSLSIVPNEATVSVTLEGDIVEDFITETHEIGDSKTDSDNQEKKKKTKKRIVKNGLIKTKPMFKQTPEKILFSDEYHVSLFRLQQKKNTDACNQIKHG